MAGSTYAGLGALLAARCSFDQSDLKTAKAQLAWVADNGKDGHCVSPACV